MTTYTKVGPFTNGSAAPPINAAFLNGVETFLTGVTSATSPAPSGSDDTAPITSWLTANAGQDLVLQPGTYTVTTITIPANTRVRGYEAKILVSGAANGIVMSGSNSSLLGVEVDGTGLTTNGNLVGMGILISNATGVTVQDCNVHDTQNNGIGFDHGTNVQIIANTVGATKNSMNGIGGTFSNNVKVYRNILSGNAGIEVWGGDPATAHGVYGCVDVQVNENSMTGGGVFLASCQDFTINGNRSVNAVDVGVDAEGCLAGTMSNNVVRDANNYGVAMFYGSNEVAITGNKVICSSTPTGLKHGIGIVTATTSKDITITGNTVRVAGNSIQTDATALSNAVIVGNRLHGAYGVLLQQSAEIAVANNEITTTGTRGIGLEGSNNCVITGNRVQLTGTDGTALGSNGGIWTYSRGGSWLGTGNTITNNKVDGYATSIKINTPANYVGINAVDTIAYAAGTSGIQFTGNYANSSPTTTINASSV